MRERRNFGRPYMVLGGQLKLVREKQMKTIDDVSGAVEIDSELLESIERGELRPSEEILLLLISHFSIVDDEAASLWELAGYEDNIENPLGLNPEQIKHMAIIMPVDTRIVYTDLVHVMANNFGIVMNFMQAGTPNGQPQPVARIGMSREHAQSVVELLQQTLAQSEIAKQTKSLPSNKSDQSKTDTN